MMREKKIGARWSDAQTQALIEFWGTDAPLPMLAQALRRTVRACEQRAHRLGLPKKPKSKPWVPHRR